MTEVQNKPSCSTGAGTRSFQYSLRTLFLLTTCLAIASSLLFASPGWIRLLSGVCLVIAWPLLLTLTLIHGSSYARTFSLGALFPSCVLLLPISIGLGYVGFFCGIDPSNFDIVDDLEEIGYGPAYFLAVDLAVSVVFGLLAVAARWALWPARPPQEVPSPLGETLLPDEAASVPSADRQ